MTIPERIQSDRPTSGFRYNVAASINSKAKDIPKNGKVVLTSSIGTNKESIIEIEPMNIACPGWLCTCSCLVMYRYSISIHGSVTRHR